MFRSMIEVVNEWSQGDERHGRLSRKGSGGAQREAADIQWHYGANHGTEPVELIAFYAGVKGTPITILQK